MQKRHIKLMIISALVFLTLVFFPNTNVKAAIDNMPDNWGVGTNFKLYVDWNDQEPDILSIRNAGNSTKWLYCIHKGASINNTDYYSTYQIEHIVNILGLKAEHNGSSIERKENASLAYILNAGTNKGYNNSKRLYYRYTGSYLVLLA